jgi:hypothetical protein
MGRRVAGKLIWRLSIALGTASVTPSVIAASLGPDSPTVAGAVLVVGMIFRRRRPPAPQRDRARHSERWIARRAQRRWPLKLLKWRQTNGAEISFPPELIFARHSALYIQQSFLKFFLSSSWDLIPTYVYSSELGSSSMKSYAARRQYSLAPGSLCCSWHRAWMSGGNLICTDQNSRWGVGVLPGRLSVSSLTNSASSLSLGFADCSLRCCSARDSSLAR